MKIILASASPRRRELLGQIGLDFEIRVSDVEEKVTASEPGAVVEELSRQKAEAVFESLGKMPGDELEDVLVIGADTVVAVGGRILGKPSNVGEAAEMLKMLSGKTHEVYTGVCLLYRRNAGGVEQKNFHEMTKVGFYPMTDKEISYYVSTGECMDKAGAYGIQGMGARYIKGLEGDYNNVVGLPIGRLYQEIKEWIL